MKIGNFEISHGDRVAFRDDRGQCGSGKANGLLMFGTHLVLDMGGAHGTPRVVYPEQICNVVSRRNRGQMDLLAAAGVA
jgi:hypothetical protein